jgi:nucleoside-diphosphate-sugar epimerase
MANVKRFLVTGAGGCIGAWAVRQLIAEGADVVAFDLRADPRRLALLMEEQELARVTWVEGDITSLESVAGVLEEHDIQAIIHLAALQVPFCRADPPLGARVNVEGTVNVFEAASKRPGRVGPVVYASSIAAHDDSTMYGVYKRANEGTAAVYHADHGVSSLGLRPHTVFGPGRDQGVTSTPTVAMLAAAAGRPYEINFGGSVAMQYAPDVAACFVAAARSDYDGHAVSDLDGDVVSIEEVVDAIVAAEPAAAGRITVTGPPLPFPAAADGSVLRDAIGPVERTPFPEAVADSIARFRRLVDAGLVTAP